MAPLVLIVGFLGSGKTSLLRKTLPALKERGVASKVILNDYQNARVDSAALSELVEAIVPIAGSCVCCESREELMNELASNPPKEGEVLFLETNGTTDSMQLIEMIFLNPALKALYHPVLQVTVVDAKRWQKRVWHNELERLQVKTATHLLLGWQDQVGGGRLGHVRRELQELNGQAEFVDYNRLVEEIQESLSVEAEEVHEHHDHHDHEGECGEHCHHDHGHAHDHHGHSHESMAHGFASVQFEPSPEMTREELTVWWQSLPESVLRAKGTLPLRGGKVPYYYFQALAGSREPHFEELDSAIDARPLVVVIGYGTEEELQQHVRRIQPANA